MIVIRYKKDLWVNLIKISTKFLLKRDKTVYDICCQNCIVQRIDLICNFFFLPRFQVALETSNLNMEHMHCSLG